MRGDDSVAPFLIEPGPGVRPTRGCGPRILNNSTRSEKQLNCWRATWARPSKGPDLSPVSRPAVETVTWTFVRRVQGGIGIHQRTDPTGHESQRIEQRATGSTARSHGRVCRIHKGTEVVFLTVGAER